MDYNQNHQNNQSNGSAPDFQNSQNNWNTPNPHSSNQWSNTNDQYSSNRSMPNSGFSIASMICGIVSIVLCCTSVLSLPLGALSIIFAILTRRRGRGMPSMSTAGLWTSAAGMLLGIFMLIYSFSLLPTMMRDPVFRRQLDSSFENLYGMDFEEFMEYYGYTFE